MINIPENKKLLKGYKFIDLFAGIGGFHYALGSFGAKCVFVSEIDKKASGVYYENFGMRPFGDITQIKEKNIPGHDILCAGFPCQAFSISGKQKGFEDTRGTLFFDIVRITKFHKPKILFLENVKNFERHDKGNTLKTVTKTLEKLNYSVFHKVLNTSHFGLPQNRERIYIIAFNKDRFSTVNFEFPTIRLRSKLEDLLENNPKDGKTIEREDMVFYKKYNPKTDLFGNMEIPNKPIQIGIVNKGGQGERIYHPKGHSITLSAHGGGVGSKTGLYKINGKIRKLSPRECARLQGFPESFKIHDSISQAHKQFGNSVSINVLQYITMNIIEAIIKHGRKPITGIPNGKERIQERTKYSGQIQ